MDAGSSNAALILPLINELVRELLLELSTGSLPSVRIAKYVPRETFLEAHVKCSTIFEKSNKQEHIAVDPRGGGRRLIAMLRVLQIIQKLLQQNKHASKRDVYYTDPENLKEGARKGAEETFREVMVETLYLLRRRKYRDRRPVSRTVAVSKGLVMGSLSYCEAGRRINCSKHNDTTVRDELIPRDYLFLCTPTNGADYILVVEKETVFQRLANDRFCIKNRCILLTGKGYPDVATRSFLRRLIDELHLPVYGLMDGDPYGLDILSTYRFGSLTMAYDAQGLAAPEILWLGVFLSDCSDFHIPIRCLLPLSKRDRRKAEAILSRSCWKHLAPAWWYERFQTQL